MAELGEV